jgi:sugar/nucleoside kinase (ribokinase family)
MDRQEACRRAAAAIEALPNDHRPEVLVGFDGFVDNIIDVVGKRTTADAYTPLPTIADFGGRVTAAAGNSANFELVIKTSKLGGNGPIMANALCAQGHRVVAMGLLGDGKIEPVFQQLAAHAAQVLSLGHPAVTDALEFSDGKLMLGKLGPLDGITFDALVAACGGMDGLKARLSSARGVATVNWTMTLGMTTIWRRLADEVLPGLRADRPLWFVDLADPAKRTADDLRAALAALRELERHADVVLGLNGAECRQVCAAVGIAWPSAAVEWEAARLACAALREHLGLSWVMCHLVRSSACAWRAHGGRTAGAVGLDGFFEPKPKITTGAGDHYNAGFTCALLAGLEPACALQVGGATSGHYVRTGASPTRAELAAFLRAAV